MKTLRCAVTVMTGFCAAGTIHEAAFGTRMVVVVVGLTLSIAGILLSAFWEDNVWTRP